MFIDCYSSKNLQYEIDSETGADGFNVKSQ